MHMNRGKDTCRHLKAIRRSIAEENGIDMEFPECSYKGSCAGTCPRCEMEARQLENELARRLSIGKLATVAGIALTLAGGANASTIEAAGSETNPLPECGFPTPTNVVGIAAADTGYAFRFIVKDAETEAALPFVNVIVMKDGKRVTGGQTGFDGIVTIAGLEDAEYSIMFSYVGYIRYVQEGMKPVLLTRKKNVKIVPILLKYSPMNLTEGILISNEADPLIDIESNGIIQVMEIEGVKVKAQY